MKVTFVTNYMTHHQLPFAEAMYKQLGDDFVFIETNAMDEERKNMGWKLDQSNYPYIKQYEDYVYDDLIMDSDVVILGGTHPVYIRHRIAAGKLTFRYFERLFKKGQFKAYIPSSYRRNKKEHADCKDKPFYLLCAGAYVASDFAIFGAYPDKMYKWGYFPKTEILDIDKVIEEKVPGSILWTGRMIDWKQPLQPLMAADILKKEGKNFHLTMIGQGPYRSKVEDYIDSHNLKDEVTLVDFVSPEEIREYMKKSSIYLMTSTGQEGWGAVVNEAMGCGCGLIASYGAGATPYLVKQSLNGLIYNFKSHKELALCIDDLLDNPDKAKRLGKAAYETIVNMWNASNAANRFIALSSKLLEGKSFFEEEGPLSKAENISMRHAYKLCRKDEVI